MLQRFGCFRLWYSWHCKNHRVEYDNNIWNIILFWNSSQGLNLDAAEKDWSQRWHSNPCTSATRLGAEHKKLGGSMLSNNLFCSSVHLIFDIISWYYLLFVSDFSTFVTFYSLFSITLLVFNHSVNIFIGRQHGRFSCSLN